MSSDSLKILILDDEEGIVQYMKKIFSNRGYVTYGAIRSEEAISFYKEMKPDICILDVHLLDSTMDGLDVLEAIKKINSDAVCIMMTRITDQESVNRAKKGGALHYLMKPLTLEEITGIIKEAEMLIRKKKNGE